MRRSTPPNPAEGNPPSGREFLVGIGASAGGLEALSLLISHLPPSLPCAYVVVQHLSPSYRSMLGEILARETVLPVREISDGEAPVPGTLYVVPPNHNIELREGHLHLNMAGSEVVPKPSVNLFFNSLAEERGETAVGIVLSGTGSDGAAGLRAIKSAGGLTFAQSPESAKYTGMPQAAIDTGATDRILPPERIAQELAELIRLHGGLAPDMETLQPELGPIAGILEAIRRHSRLDFTGYKSSTVLRRIQRRLVATQTHTLEAYLAHLEGNPAEIERLSREILISVTAFFRDRDAFATLERAVREILARRPPGSELRVWVAGCATGEEAYSIALLFAETLGERLPQYKLQIFATDIDEEALNIARRGLYPAAAMIELSAEQLTRYFIAGNEHYEVGKTLRDLVIFARQDLVQDPPFLRLDLISCRNVLIYFENTLQARVLASLHYALGNDGYLFLGRSESVSQQDELFLPVDRKDRLFRKRAVANAPGGPLLRARLDGSAPYPSRREKPLERVALDALLDNQHAGIVLIDDDSRILYTGGISDQLLRIPSGAPELNLNQILISELKGEFLTLMHRARRHGQTVTGRKRRVGERLLRLSVMPQTRESGERLYLLLFQPEAQATAPEESEPPPVSGEKGLEDELLSTREHLQTLVEEMATSNEEMQALNEEAQASNEELQATNEELEAANEELQATNEELVSLNEEMMVKSAEIAALNADYENLYNALDFPVLVFDTDLRLRRHNTSAAHLFQLLPSANGQPASRLRLPDWLESLPERLESVLTRGEKHAELIESGPCTHQMFITPGFSAGGEVIGLVLTLIDHSELVTTQRELDESRQRILTVMDSATVLFALKDPQGNYRFVNRRYAEFFGLNPEAMLGHNDRQLLPPDIAQKLREQDFLALRELQRVEYGYRFEHDGHTVWLDAVHIPLLDPQGNLSALCMQAIDVSARKHADEQLRLAAKVFDRSGEAIAITDEQGRIITANEAFERVTGYPLDEVRGHTPALLKSGRHSNEFYQAMWKKLRELGWWQGEVWNRRKNGEIYPEWLTINGVEDEDGVIRNFVGIFSDISAIKNAQRKAEYLSTHDELTALPNRSLFQDRLRHAIAQARRAHQRLAVLFIDLDNFKSINDTFGHETGDLVLKEAAQRLLRCVRDTDTLARLGGDEFTAILSDVELPQITSVCDRIIDYLSASFEIEGKEYYLSASVGISLFPEDGEDSGTLTKSADSAMYRAKEQGRNQYQFFTEELRVLAYKRLAMESGLRNALRENGLHLVFQPQMELDSGHLIGCEALLRWNNPALGEIPPSEFIPVAEKTTLIRSLGNWVINQVLDHIRRWREAGLCPPRISINTAPSQLREIGFADGFLDQLAQYGLAPTCVTLEVTEGALVNPEDGVVSTLRRLRESGVAISIDDFGTGYSSLGYLKKLPIDELKIDRGFIDGIGHDRDDESITRAILSLSQALGLTVVAEGVETSAQLDILKALGCDRIQGYYYHRPLEAAAFRALLPPAGMHPEAPT